MWSLYVTKTRFKYGHQYDVDEKETGLNYKLTLQQYLTPTKKKNLFLYTQHLLGNVYVTLVFDLRLRKCLKSYLKLLASTMIANSRSSSISTDAAAHIKG